jgi:hypothetical protein
MATSFHQGGSLLIERNFIGSSAKVLPNPMVDGIFAIGQSQLELKKWCSAS